MRFEPCFWPGFAVRMCFRSWAGKNGIFFSIASRRRRLPGSYIPTLGPCEGERLNSFFNLELDRLRRNEHAAGRECLFRD